MIDIVILCPLSIEYNAVRAHISHLFAQKEARFGFRTFAPHYSENYI